MKNIDHYGGDDSYITQMRDIYLVSRNIAHWYLLTSPYIAYAGRLSYIKSSGAKKQENLNRSRLIDYFSTLVIMSCRLPRVRDELKKGKYHFKDGPELLDKLWTADLNRTKSTVLVQWWYDYADALIKAGLITAYEIQKSDRAAFRSF